MFNNRHMGTTPHPPPWDLVKSQCYHLLSHLWFLLLLWLTVHYSFIAVPALCFWFFKCSIKLMSMPLGSHSIVWTAFRLPTALMLFVVSCEHLDLKKAIHVWTPPAAVGKEALCYIHKMLRSSQELDHTFINTIKKVK